MAPQKPKGPSSFCEWVVGTSIPSALGPLPRKPPRRRDVVRVEISTDDESETDSLKITYPRSRSRKRHSGTAVKKVRFEGTPRKSALKKKAAIITSESEPDMSESSSERPTSEEDIESDQSPARKSKKKKKRQSDQTNTGSDEDSEPHPTCQCLECVSGRKRRKNQGKTCEKHKGESTAADSSDSEANEPGKNKVQKKGSRQVGEFEGEEENDDDESSTSAADTDDEHLSKKKDTKSGPPGKKSKKQTQRSEEGSEESGREAKTTKKKKGSESQGKHKQADAAVSRKKEGKKNGNYPEALPMPHTRRPHYIEPIRAEVVQTERVMETPEDPPPNAYYDAEHNIIRVYHGPVWGGNPSQSLYPRKEDTHRPLPMGTPHPSQNPYLHGFSNQPNPRPPGFENVLVTQGMPVNAWHAAMPPPPGYPPHNYAQHLDQEAGMNRGAFSKMPYPSGKGPSSSKGKDKSGANNVGPGSVKVSVVPLNIRRLMLIIHRVGKITLTTKWPNPLLKGLRSLSSAIGEKSSVQPPMEVDRLMPKMRMEIMAPEAQERTRMATLQDGTTTTTVGGITLTTPTINTTAQTHPGTETAIRTLTMIPIQTRTMIRGTMAPSLANNQLSTAITTSRQSRPCQVRGKMGRAPLAGVILLWLPVLVDRLIMVRITKLTSLGKFLRAFIVVPSEKGLGSIPGELI